MKINDEEFTRIKEEAKSIPIIEVGELVVTDFSYRGNMPTGRCCKHVDEKWGNFHFRTKNNVAKCYSCGQVWDSIGLVEDYKGLNFAESVNFLYDHFPEYFSKKPFSDVQYEKEEWYGLTNKEYRYLKIPTRLLIKDKMISIRQVYKEFPYEHDILLIKSVIRIKNDVERIFKYRVHSDNNATKDKAAYYNKIFELIKKGMYHQNLISGKRKINLDQILFELIKTEQEIA